MRPVSETRLHPRADQPTPTGAPNLRVGRIGAAAEIEPNLAEWDYGDYEGLPPAEIGKQRPGWEVFRDGCPGGETPPQVSDRADRLLQSLRALEGNVALFTHGHFGRALAVRWIGLPIEGRRFALRTASIGILGHDPAHPDAPVIALWNDVPAERVRGPPSAS